MTMTLALMLFVSAVMATEMMTKKKRILRRESLTISLATNSSADVSEADYVLGRNRHNVCPWPYQNILTASTCQEAAQKLGYIDNTLSFDSSMWDTRPRGCFHWGTPGRACFNTNPGIPTHPSKGLHPICKKPEACSMLDATTCAIHETRCEWNRAQTLCADKSFIYNGGFGDDWNWNGWHVTCPSTTGARPFVMNV
jgi:hypothetical protein